MVSYTLCIVGGASLSTRVYWTLVNTIARVLALAYTARFSAIAAAAAAEEEAEEEEPLDLYCYEVLEDSD